MPPNPQPAAPAIAPSSPISDPKPEGERIAVVERMAKARVDQSEAVATKATGDLAEARGSNERLAAEVDRLNRSLADAIEGRDAAVRTIEEERLAHDKQLRELAKEVERERASAQEAVIGAEKVRGRLREQDKLDKD